MGGVSPRFRILSRMDNNEDPNSKEVKVPLLDTPAPCVSDFPAFDELTTRALKLHKRVDGKQPIRSKRFQIDCEIAAFCRPCPMAFECGKIGERNRYSGIAGGQVMILGKIRSTLIPKPAPSTELEPDDAEDSRAQNTRRRAV